MNRRRRPNVSSPLGLSTFTRLRLRAALFLAGAVVMALGIVGSRIIAPHFGAGLFVGTSLISVAMLALAFGYWLGGQIVDRRPSVLLFSGVLFLAAVVVAVIPVWNALVIEAGWKFGLRSGSLFAAACILFPPLLLLGMASPIAVRLEAGELERAGRSAGGIHSIPMAGAAVGAVLAGFLLLPSYRVPTVLEILAGTLAAAAILGIGAGYRKRAVAAAIGIIIIGGLSLISPKPRPKELLAAKSDGGRDLRVVSHEGSRYLFVDQALQSTVNAQGRTEEKYLYFLASRLILARPQMKSAALVGLGGAGVIPLLKEHHVEVVCVDSSAQALALAGAHLGLALPDSQVYAADGRFFLQSHTARFDSVILDVFTGERPAVTLATVEGLAAAKSALAPGGILALNTWAFDQDRKVPSPAGAAIYATLRQVFSQVLAVPTSENLLFFASDLPIQPQRSSALLTAFDVPRHFTWLPIPDLSWPTAPVLTDESNPLSTLEIASLESIRQSLRTCYPPSVRDALVWE